MLLLKRNPFYLFLLPFWLIKGKAHLKRYIALRINLDVASLPYNQALLQYLRQEQGQGRHQVLITASDEHLARPIAAYLDLFDDLYSSNGQTNLEGRQKLDLLVRKFGAKQFDYVGNSSVDLPIWEQANLAFIVNARGALAKKAASLAKTDERFLKRDRGNLQVFLRAIRIHQWVKNVLLFVPLLTSHQIFNMAAVTQAVAAFFAFGLTASSVYILNDLCDLTSDRRHPVKKNRPFASGVLAVRTGMLLSPLLLTSGLALSLALSPTLFTLLLLFYFGLNILYSFYFKKRALLDVLLLAGLYTLRVFAGAVVIGVVLSQWLLAFSIFFFLSLAMMKRTAELRLMRTLGGGETNGRGYQVGDSEFMSISGIASGYLAVLVMALYINSTEIIRLYLHPVFLWALCPLLLYWIIRAWMITCRDLMHSDPIVFAAKDKVSYGVLLGIGGCVLLAI